MAALSDGEAAALEALASELGMDVLIEVHDADELARAPAPKSRLIGINNRNLQTLAVHLATTEALARIVPDDRMLVSERGQTPPPDLARIARAGAHCFLIGESLLRPARPAEVPE